MNTQRRTSECLSDFMMDGLLTEEGGRTPRAERQRAHLEGCGLCARRLDELERDAAAFRARAPIAELAAATARQLDAGSQPGRRARWQTRVAVFATVAAAVAVVALVARPRDDGAGIRSKGDLQIDVFVKRRGGQVEAATSPARVSPGDALRFRISTARNGYLGVAGLDGAGAVSSYWPPSAQLLPIQAGRGQLLDGAIELDGVLGRERITALLCSEPLATDDVLRALRARLAAAHADPARVDAVAGFPCRETSFWIDKVAPR
jgi:hypothetical protein